jgi:hypothetical protein
MANKTLYLIREGIDLGDCVHGVFDSHELAHKALEEMQAAYEKQMDRPHDDLSVEEFPLNEVVCCCWWWKRRDEG